MPASPWNRVAIRPQSSPLNHGLSSSPVQGLYEEQYEDYVTEKVGEKSAIDVVDIVKGCGHGKKHNRNPRVGVFLPPTDLLGASAQASSAAKYTSVNAMQLPMIEGPADGTPVNNQSRPDRT